TDIWFRPVQMANGPDGALYVLDMYRHVIEAAEFMPPSIVKHLDVSAGFDKGRLYRIVPEGFQRPRPPRLGKASSAELVALLDHPVDDPDLRVRYQLAFSLGAVRGEMPSRALVKLARRDGADSWFRLAILSSINGRAGEVFRLLLADPEFRTAAHGRELLAAL